MVRKTKRIKKFIESIKKTLDFELPFEEFNTPKPINEDVFFDYFVPYLRESIEECFCAKVRNEGKQDFVVLFETGEKMSLKLYCEMLKNERT